MFGALPDSLACLIYSWLGFRAHVALSATCRRLSGLANRPESSVQGFEVRLPIGQGVPTSVVKRRPRSLVLHCSASQATDTDSHEDDDVQITALRETLGACLDLRELTLPSERFRASLVPSTLWQLKRLAFSPAERFERATPFDATHFTSLEVLRVSDVNLQTLPPTLVVLELYTGECAVRALSGPRSATQPHLLAKLERLQELEIWNRCIDADALDEIFASPSLRKIGFMHVQRRYDSDADSDPDSDHDPDPDSGDDAGNNGAVAAAKDVAMVGLEYTRAPIRAKRLPSRPTPTWGAKVSHFEIGQLSAIADFVHLAPHVVSLRLNTKVRCYVNSLVWDMSSLAKFRNLRYLYVGFNERANAVLAAISGMPLLEILVLEMCTGLGSLLPLGTLPKLSALELRQFVDSALLATLPRLEALCVLFLCSPEPREAEERIRASCPSLSALKIIV